MRLKQKKHVEKVVNFNLRTWTRRHDDESNILRSISSNSIFSSEETPTIVDLYFSPAIFTSNTVSWIFREILVKALKFHFLFSEVVRLYEKWIFAENM